MRHSKDFRKNVLQMTQSNMAAALNRPQPTVAYWEKMGYFPVSAIGAVRRLGKSKLGRKWNDSLLFDDEVEK